jgi:uncharacterized protein (DUF2235 family)
MSRNIVVCLDGTNNKFNRENTNVVKLYALLDRKTSDQIAYYQPGIGTMFPPGSWGRIRKWFIARLDLAIAWLLEDHVCAAYRFLMRYYEEGDRIYIFGFSRGAYEARVLAAMLNKTGLLGKGNEELVPFAWDIFGRKYGDRTYEGFHSTFGRTVKIHFLGLWDTVSSVGWAWNAKHFQFTADNHAVETVRHAVALDERRTYFVQNLWRPRDESKVDMLQVWYPGVHCDVGGGYPESESGLSKVTLQWMVGQAEAKELKFSATALAETFPPQAEGAAATADVLPMKHESLKGLWWIPELIPRHLKDPHGILPPRWLIPLGHARVLDPGANIHSSVFERQKKDPTYRPSNIPTPYTEVQ